MERLKARSTYQQAVCLPTTSQSILDIACARSFLSPLVICAGSNRALEILDLAACRSARSIPDAHERQADHSRGLSAAEFGSPRCARATLGDGGRQMDRKGAI